MINVKTTVENYKSVVLQRAILICWALLFVCFTVKIFGGNWFEVVCTNEHFSNVCQFVQNNKIVFEIVSFIIYIFPTVLIVLSFARIPNPNTKQLLFITISLIVLWTSRFISMNAKTFLELVFLISCPIPLNYFWQKEESFINVVKKTWYYGIVGYIIALCFQTISLLTRNIGIKIISKDVLITFIMLIDYYIMLILYYLYIKLMKGGKENNG